MQRFAAQLRDSQESCGSCLLAKNERRQLEADVERGLTSESEALSAYAGYVARCGADLELHPPDFENRVYSCGNLNRDRRERDPHAHSVIVIVDEGDQRYD